MGNLRRTSARNVVDASGLAVAPGFINMLSWSTESLIVDGRSQGEIRQGVTTQIMGEGWSMGPLNERLKKQVVAEQDDIKFDIEWTTLAEYLRYLEKRGVSQNVASFVGGPPSGSTYSAREMCSRPRRNLRKCASLCARRWRRARSASAHP